MFALCNCHVGENASMSSEQFRFKMFIRRSFGASCVSQTTRKSSKKVLVWFIWAMFVVAGLELYLNASIWSSKQHVTSLDDRQDLVDPSASRGSVYPCLDQPIIQLAEDGSLSEEEKRLITIFTEVQIRCDRLELPGRPGKTLTTEREDLRETSYVCFGGKSGLQKHDCLIYSFGIKHKWAKFPELVEKYLGCHVHVFDPAMDYIDHYYSWNIKFFNARLSDFDQQAQYNTPGEKGWKYRKFSTIMKEMHFSYQSIDHVRLDVTLDLWKGMSTMLKDCSLFTFVKQLSFEYDFNRKNAENIREMFAITQWLNKQGFRLAHSQPTKLSEKSYALLYVNTKMDTTLGGIEYTSHMTGK